MNPASPDHPERTEPTLPEVCLTADGSCTLRDPRTGEHYHSLHGAQTESEHVFVREGLLQAWQQFQQPLQILEVGFGSGLNALLSWQFAERHGARLSYLGTEPWPLPPASWNALDFPCFYQMPEVLKNPFEPTEKPTAWDEVPQGSLWKNRFRMLHETAEWSGQAGQWQNRTEDFFALSPNFQFTVSPCRIQDLETVQQFHVVYFDAFSSEREPALWTPDIWRKIFAWLIPGGMMTTYSSKGWFRRQLQEAGFQVERLAGPPHKRHMTRATKPRHKA